MSNSDPLHKKNQSTNSNEDLLDKLSAELSTLSYEQSIKELDNILNKLQNDDLLVDELQISYLKANLYLKHCEMLLGDLEQEIITLSPKDIDWEIVICFLQHQYQFEV